MARTLLPTIMSVHSGVPLTTTTADSANGNMFANDEKSVLVMINLTAGTLHCTIVASAYADSDLKIPDRVIALNSGEQIMAGPFPAGVFSQVDGNVYVDTDGALELVVSSIKGVRL